MTDDRFEYRPQDFVSVITPTIVYVGIARREDFDKIAAPVKDSGEMAYGHVLTKTVGADPSTGTCIIFQHWLKSLTSAAFRADRDARIAARAAISVEADDGQR